MEGIRYKLITNIEPSFSRSSNKRCFRVGGRKGARIDAKALPLPCVQLIPPGHRSWQHGVMYQISISPEQRERWPKQPASFYVCAENAEAVHSYLDKRFGNIAKRHMGVAHLAIGEAMGKVSTRPAAGRSGPHAGEIARKVVKVTYGSGLEFKVTVEDDLSYAVDAFVSGSASLDRAFMLAANRVAGRLRNIGGHGLDEDLQTPFPEVRRKK